MQGRRSRQFDAFSVAELAPSLIEPDSFYALLHRLGPVLISDDDFSEMYADNVGRPSLPPSLLSQVLLLQEHDGVSDREAARRVRADLDWKYALHLPLDYQGFAHSNLAHFRARLLVHNLECISFDKVNELAVKLGVLDPEAPRAIDSSHIFGAAAVQDTYTLLRTALRDLLVTLLERDRQAAEALIEELDLSDYQSSEKPEIDWADAEARAAWLKTIVADGRRLLEEIDATPLVDAGVREAASLLTQILNQDITEGDDGEPEIKQGVEKDRVVSTEDSEMRHGRKSSSLRFDGYKVHVAEELETELITDIEVTPGNVHDSEPVEEMLTDSAERLGGAPRAIIGDSHYGSTDLRVDLAEHGIDVIAKLPGIAFSKGGYFTKADFDVDLEAEAVTCPAGHTTQKYYRARDDKGRRTRRYQFPATACNACALKARCTRSDQGRTILLNYHEETLQKAYAHNQSDAFKATYRRRALVERKLSELLWRHGLRFGRFIGTRKTRLQALWTAAVVNLKRLGKLLAEAFETPEEAILAAAA